MRPVTLVALAIGFLPTRALVADDSFPPAALARQADCPVVSRVSLSRSAEGVVETRNFRVAGALADTELRDLANDCERRIVAARRNWLGTDSREPWVPKCEIMVHPNLEGYAQQLGAGSEQTSGCATLQLDGGRVVVRRIDLRVDAADWKSESLPHELMHVVLADPFASRRLAPWADEGIAMLAESSAKRARRLAAIRQIIPQDAVYSAADLLRVRTSPQPAYRTAFYGQSMALAGLLLERGSREQLLRFTAAAQNRDPATAFAECYGENAWSQLDRDLQSYISSDRLLAADRR